MTSSFPQRVRLCLAAGALILALPAPSLHAANSAAREWNEQNLAAIRLDIPNPPAHARTLFHTAVAMYGAWAAYDTTAVGYLVNEKITPLPVDVETARREAVSYAAYRVLRARYSSSTGAATSLPAFDAKLTSMGYSPVIAQSAVTAGTSPAEVGKRIGQAILNWSANDQFTNTGYPTPYDFNANSNLFFPMLVLGTNLAFQTNAPLGGVPAGTNPNLWQPLSLSGGFTQNGIPIPGGQQDFLGVQGLATTPFALTRTDPVKPWIDPGPPSRVSRPGNPSATNLSYKQQALAVLKDSARLNSTTMVNISPAALGANPLGADTGTGTPINPVTSAPYAPNMVELGDYSRVLAEFWADGPRSETPPGHWHAFANETTDSPLLVKRIRGTGPVVNDLEWDVKMYFAVSASTHDAACAAWALKRYYSGMRPITMIRYLASKGQSSDPGQLSYSTEGILLEPGVCEVITAASSAPGQRHELIWDLRFGGNGAGADYIGQIAVYSWPGEHPSNPLPPAAATNKNQLVWMLGTHWLPFQRKTFNTPAFPGYISGHSTFSRAAAEALALFTGSPYFPGGFHHYTFPANSMQIDKGPSAPVDLQWCTFYDAADQAGQSRRWGGIHPPEDDYPGRVVGSQAGIGAFTLAEKYWSGTITGDVITPSLTYSPSSVRVSWTATRGAWYKVQTSTTLSGGWTDATSFTPAYSTLESWEDDTFIPARKFYRVVRSFSGS